MGNGGDWVDPLREGNPILWSRSKKRWKSSRSISMSRDCMAHSDRSRPVVYDELRLEAWWRLIVATCGKARDIPYLVLLATWDLVSILVRHSVYIYLESLD